MKRASATAGIASLLAGLAMVLSSVPAHALFIYLNQSALNYAAASTTRTDADAKVVPVSGARSTGSIEVQDPKAVQERKDAQSAAREQVSSSSGSAKDAPAIGAGAMTPPAAAAIDRVASPVVDAASPASPAVPDWIEAPPIVNRSIVGDIGFGDAGLISLPTRTVPDPATIGLLGLGLLLTFVAHARRDRARTRRGRT